RPGSTISLDGPGRLSADYFAGAGADRDAGKTGAGALNERACIKTSSCTGRNNPILWSIYRIQYQFKGWRSIGVLAELLLYHMHLVYRIRLESGLTLGDACGLTDGTKTRTHSARQAFRPTGSIGRRRHMMYRRFCGGEFSRDTIQP